MDSITKNTLIGIAGALALIIGLIWIARPTANNSSTTANIGSESGGALAAEVQSYDFGTISMAAGKVSYVFTIKNNGTGPVAIEKIYTSCMCTTAKLDVGDAQFGPYGMQGHGVIPKINQSLGPNEEATVEVVFDPAAHGPAGVGHIERVVRIEHSGGEPLELAISTTVTP